jgi:WD40 repeat protein
MKDYLNNKKPQKILLPLIRTLEGYSSWATAVSVTPDGNYAVSASDDRTLKCWDFRTGKISAFSGESPLVVFLSLQMVLLSRENIVEECIF